MNFTLLLFATVGTAASLLNGEVNKQPSLLLPFFPTRKTKFHSWKNRKHKFWGGTLSSAAVGGEAVGGGGGGRRRWGQGITGGGGWWRRMGGKVYQKSIWSSAATWFSFATNTIAGWSHNNDDGKWWNQGRLQYLLDLPDMYPLQFHRGLSFFHSCFQLLVSEPYCCPDINCGKRQSVRKSEGVVGWGGSCVSKLSHYARVRKLKEKRWRVVENDRLASSTDLQADTRGGDDNF